MNGYSPDDTVLCAMKHRSYNVRRIRNEKQTIFFRNIFRAREELSK